jgi:hypothetical protein
MNEQIKFDESPEIFDHLLSKPDGPLKRTRVEKYQRVGFKIENGPPGCARVANLH